MAGDRRGKFQGSVLSATTFSLRGIERRDVTLLGLALVAGMLAAVSPKFAIVFVVAAGTLLLMIAKPSAFVPLLIASVYFGSIRFGDLTIARVIGPFAFVVAVVMALRNGTWGLRGSSLHRWIGAYGLLAVASLYWTQDDRGTVVLLSSLTLAVTYMLAIVGLTRTREDLELAMRTFPFAALGLSITGSVAFLAYGGAIAAQPLIGDRNFFAAFLVVALPPSFALLRSAEQAWLRAAAVAAIAMCLMGVVVSGSQGGMLALLGMVVAAVLLTPDPRWRRRAVPVLVLAAPLVAVLATVILTSGGSDTAGTSTKVAITRSSVDRVNLWRGALHGYQENPVLGLGFGGFAGNASKLMLETPGVELRLYKLPRVPQEPHNSYLEALVELGPLGLFIYLGMIGAAAATLARVLKRTRSTGDTVLSRTSHSLLLSLIGFAIAAFFLSIQTNRGWWVIFGLTIVCGRLMIESETREPASA